MTVHHRSADIALRLECMALATRCPGDPVPNARAIYAFVTGEADQTPRERLLAAVDACTASAAG